MKIVCDVLLSSASPTSVHHVCETTRGLQTEKIDVLVADVLTGSWTVHRLEVMILLRRLSQLSRKRSAHTDRQYGGT